MTVRKNVPAPEPLRRPGQPRTSMGRTGIGLDIAKNTNTHPTFPADYIQSAFVLWYNSGKLDAENFWPILANDNPAMRPSIKTLETWIIDQFAYKAMELDDQVGRQLDKTLVEGKLEMLERQAKVGQQMQEMAWNFLLENGPESSRNAITLLKLGLETEREARSLPAFLKGIEKMPDSEVVDEIKKLLSGDPDILDLEASDDGEV